jgi:large subunit ribosomal protein L18
MSKKSKTKMREERLARRHRRVRKRIFGTPERPRLVVHRSLKHIQGHVVDDVAGVVRLGVSTLAPELKELRENPETTKTDLSRAAGKLLAEKARAAGIVKVVFDRGGYLYHGRVAAFAEGAREGGLEF